MRRRDGAAADRRGRTPDPGRGGRCGTGRPGHPGRPDDVPREHPRPLRTRRRGDRRGLHRGLPRDRRRRPRGGGRAALRGVRLPPHRPVHHRRPGLLHPAERTHRPGERHADGPRRAHHPDRRSVGPAHGADVPAPGRDGHGPLLPRGVRGPVRAPRSRADGHHPALRGRRSPGRRATGAPLAARRTRHRRAARRCARPTRRRPDPHRRRGPRRRCGRPDGGGQRSRRGGRRRDR